MGDFKETMPVSDVGRLFMDRTRFEMMDEPARRKGAPPPLAEKPFDERVQLLELPSRDAVKLANNSFNELVDLRRSIRKYSDEEMSREELSYILWCTQGVQKVSESTDMPGNPIVTLRTVPSAGARHPFETLILVNRVQGLQAGLYRYVASKHKLLNLDAPADIAQKLTEACYNQKIVSSSAFTLIWVADIYRSAWSYGERAYRYIFLDAGHVCQNFYLVAEALGCGACCIATFNDTAVNNLVGVDGVQEFTVYMGTVGRK